MPICHLSNQLGTVQLKVADDSEDLLDSEEQSTLRAGIGKLMWHMQYSRPDVSQAVRDLARHMTRGDRSHMDTMLRCMKYLVCTRRGCSHAQECDTEDCHTIHV